MDEKRKAVKRPVNASVMMFWQSFIFTIGVCVIGYLFLHATVFEKWKVYETERAELQKQVTALAKEVAVLTTRNTMMTQRMDDQLVTLQNDFLKLQDEQLKYQVSILIDPSKKNLIKKAQGVVAISPNFARALGVRPGVLLSIAELPNNGRSW